MPFHNCILYICMLSIKRVAYLIGALRRELCSFKHTGNIGNIGNIGNVRNCRSYIPAVLLFSRIHLYIFSSLLAKNLRIK